MTDTGAITTAESYVQQLAREFDPGQGPLMSLRTAGLSALEAVGFPTPADEEWKYTNAAPIVKAQLLPAAKASCEDIALAGLAFPEQSWLRVVLLNGRFCPELSTGLQESGVVVMSLAEAAAGSAGQPASLEKIGSLARPASDGFTAANAAFFPDGVYLRVQEGTTLEAPVHISCVFTGEASAAFPRVLIDVEENAEASVVETFRSQGASLYLTNYVSEVFLGPGARLKLVRLQEEGPGAFHVSNTQVSQSGNSTFKCVTVSLGGALVRNDLSSVLLGDGCECDLNGLSVVDGSRHVDNHTLIDHASPNCSSHELYKAVLDDASRNVFNGKVIVRPDAQKTDARQTNRNLLLSGDARVDTKPQLEIFADDVKCTHGATIGQLDDQQLFYLRSRGIGLQVAKQLLTFGFAYDIVERIDLQVVRDYLDGVLISALHTSEEFQSIHDNFRT